MLISPLKREVRDIRYNIREKDLCTLLNQATSYFSRKGYKTEGGECFADDDVTHASYSPKAQESRLVVYSHYTGDVQRTVLHVNHGSDEITIQFDGVINNKSGIEYICQVLDANGKTQFGFMANGSSAYDNASVFRIIGNMSTWNVPNSLTRIEGKKLSSALLDFFEVTEAYMAPA